MNEKVLNAAKNFIESHFPDAETAILAGSHVRKEATPTSDLDIVIITDNPQAPYRETFFENGFPIEVFVHTRESYLAFFELDAETYTPSLANMIYEGIILKNDNKYGDILKEEAKRFLNKGPKSLTEKQKEDYRYFITDLLDDFIGSDDYSKNIFIVTDLVSKISQYILLSNNLWIGKGKNTLKALKKYDSALTETISDELENYFKTSDKQKLIDIIEHELNIYGGRLYSGYSRGKKNFKKKIILTGFDPFGGESINPSWEMLKDLESKSVQIIKMHIPVVFDKSYIDILKKIDEENPDYVIMFGQAGGRFAITPERVAINIDEAGIPDNEKNQPHNKIINENGKNAYFSTLPLDGIIETLKKNNIPAKISNSAGTYVCNHTMYNIMNYIESNNLKTKAGFIHIPYIAEQVISKNDLPYMELETLKNAAKIIVEYLGELE